jgi:hypothetical protein
LALSLFAIFKRELPHYHEELMSQGARQHRRAPSIGRHPSADLTEAARWWGKSSMLTAPSM